MQSTAHRRDLCAFWQLLIICYSDCVIHTRTPTSCARCRSWLSYLAEYRAQNSSPIGRIVAGRRARPMLSDDPTRVSPLADRSSAGRIVLANRQQTGEQMDGISDTRLTATVKNSSPSLDAADVHDVGVFRDWSWWSHHRQSTTTISGRHCTASPPQRADYNVNLQYELSHVRPRTAHTLQGCQRSRLGSIYTEQSKQNTGAVKRDIIWWQCAYGNLLYESWDWGR